MACTSGSVWASRHTLPAPCRQQHRYLTQHVSSLSLSVSLHLWSPICNHLRLCSASALNEKYLRTPALSKLMSTVQGQISSQPEPQHFQIDLKGSGRVGVGWGGVTWVAGDICRRPVLSDWDAQLAARAAGLIWACVQKAVLSTTSAGREHRATPWSLSISWSVSQWQCRLSVRKKTIHCCAIKRWAHWHTYLCVCIFIHSSPRLCRCEHLTYLLELHL